MEFHGRFPWLKPAGNRATAALLPSRNISRFQTFKSGMNNNLISIKLMDYVIEVMD